LSLFHTNQQSHSYEVMKNWRLFRWHHTRNAAVAPYIVRNEHCKRSHETLTIGWPCKNRLI